MQHSPYQVANGYAVVGLAFSLFSYDRPNGTHWGYALAGVACLVLSGWFYNVHFRSVHPTEKARNSDWPVNG